MNRMRLKEIHQRMRERVNSDRAEFLAEGWCLYRCMNIYLREITGDPIRAEQDSDFRLMKIVNGWVYEELQLIEAERAQLKQELPTATPERAAEIKKRLAQIKISVDIHRKNISRNTLNVREQEAVFFLVKRGYGFAAIARFLHKDSEYLKTWFYRVHVPIDDA